MVEKDDKNQTDIDNKDDKSKINIDDKLFMDRFITDKTSHLAIKDQDVCKKCEDRKCTIFCPAGVYELNDGKINVGYEGCLECGACRIACPYNNIEWTYPRGGFGVQFKKL